MPRQQFSGQLRTLVGLGYPELLGMNAATFRAALEPLAEQVPECAGPACDAERGAVPFVVIINSARAPVSATLPLIERAGKQAVERLYPIEPRRFVPIAAVRLPAGQAYLLLDIDRGKDTLNVTPDAALGSILGSGRSPLTIEEGLALLTHFPEFLQPNNCYSMLGSRCGDKRVPALWLSEGWPKLGWCWAGNPHTWLGSASCAARSGAVELPVVAGVTAKK